MKRSILLAIFLGLGAFASAEPNLKPADRLYFQGESQKALEAYLTVLHSTTSVPAALSAAHIAAELGRYDDGINILAKALKKNPDNVFLKRDLAWLYFGEEKQGKAAPLFQEIATSTGDVLAQLGCGLIQMENKNYAVADQIFQQMVTAWPHLAIAYYFLGENNEKQEKMEGAAAFYERSLTEDSHFIEARLRLGAVFENRKLADDAWRQYARISYADPGNIQAMIGMARLIKKITKKPEEIVPPKVIEKNTPVPEVIDAAGLPMLKIGIGTSQSGTPTPKKAVRFRTSTPFVILNSTNSQQLAEGKAVETYEVKIATNNRYVIISNKNGEELVKSGSSILIRQNDSKATTILNALSYAPGTTWGGMADKELRGVVEVVFDRKNKRLILINHVNIEEYIYGVLSAEMPVHWPLEALKAQAVIVRTLALKRRQDLRLHRKYGYDLCDEQHCQVYTGVGVESDKVRTAVDGTRGLVLKYEGELVHAVFSSNCGGITCSGAQAGWGDVKYWKSVSDARPGNAMPTAPWEFGEWLRSFPSMYCCASSYVWMPEYRWWRVVPAEVVARRVARKRNIGRIRQIRVLKRNAAGRVRKLEFIGTNGVLDLTKEHEIRRYLGLGLMRSDMFVIRRVVRNEKTQRFIITGGGWGHGVGFCQSGAAGQAEDGKSFADILSHYFPGATVKKVQ